MPYITIHHKKLFRMFRDKNIAVVGNAISLYDKNYGEVIDTNDIVVRFNLGLKHNSNTTHGSKTDWLIYNNDVWARSVNLFDNKQHLNWMQIYYMHDSSPVSHNVYTIPEFVQESLFTKGNFTRSNKPSIGLLFVHFLTYVNAKQVNIFGFDHKQSLTFYNTNRKRKKDLRGKGHDWLKEQTFLTDTIIKTHSNFNIHR